MTTLPRLTDWQLQAHIIAAIRVLQGSPSPTEEDKAAFTAWEADWEHRLSEALTARQAALKSANAMARLANTKEAVQAAIDRANGAQATLQALQKELAETLNAALVAGLVGADYFDERPDAEGPVV